MNDSSSEPNDSDDNREQVPRLIVPVKVGWLPRLRTYFLTGIVVAAPIGITLYIAWKFITFVDNKVTPLIPRRYNPESYLPFDIPGLGLIVAVALLTLVGAVTANFFGRTIVAIGERLVARMPVIRTVYGALKQIFETVLAQSSTSFREVVLVEYPRTGVWAIAFVTSQTKGEIGRVTDGDMVNIFLPTTPNPTSGFLLFVPRKDVISLHMTVEEGIKLVISGGLVTPPVSLAEPPERDKLEAVSGASG